VRFTLESLHGRTFPGKVESKRLMPSIQDNVVSYKVIISVSNRDGSLLPGMTCSVEFIEERSENILVVPNAALRYQPTFLSAAEIEDIVFFAGLRGLDETQRAEAIGRREEARRAAASGDTNRQGGLASLMAPPTMGRRLPGTGGGAGQAGQPRAQPRNSGGGLSPPRPLWFINSNGRPDVILVHTGISDGSRTEIQPRQGEEISEGKQIILRERIRL